MFVLTTNFAKGLNEHHRVVIEISTFLLSLSDLLQNHHEGLIEHLLFQKVLYDLPLKSRLLSFINLRVDLLDIEIVHLFRCAAAKDLRSLIVRIEEERSRLRMRLMHASGK